MKTQIFLLFSLFPIFLFAQSKSSIDFVFSVEHTNRVLYGYVETPENSFFGSRNDEKGKMSSRIGFNYNLRIRPNIYFKTGLRYAKVGYHSDAQSIRIGTLTIATTGNGGTIGAFESVRLGNTINYKFIEVPLVLRYEFQATAFSPFLEVGLSPHFYLDTGSSRMIKIDDFEYVNFNTLQIVGSLSFGVRYQFSERLQVFGQPIFRYHVTDLSDDPEEEHLYGFGVELGIRANLK